VADAMAAEAIAPGGVMSRHAGQRLDELVAGIELIIHVRRLAAWAQVLERGYEGYVAKNKRSKYVGGGTRAAWVNGKTPGERMRTIVGGGEVQQRSLCSVNRSARPSLLIRLILRPSRR
jgi:hypothetical protein